MNHPVQPNATPKDPSWRDAIAYPLGTLGAFIGASAGAALTLLLVHRGYYPLIAIGVLAGFGSAFLAKRGGWILATLAAAIALSLSLSTEWYVLPFKDDDSLRFFLTHLASLTPFSLLTHAANALIAGFLAFRR